MTIQQIPFTSHPDFTETVDLDGASYLLHFYYNTRMSTWFMDVSDASGNVIVQGRSLVLGSFLLDPVVGQNGPPGEMFLIDTANRNQDADYDDLGSRVLLLYAQEADINALL
jgi:hypothetical protein